MPSSPNEKSPTPFPSSSILPHTSYPTPQDPFETSSYEEKETYDHAEKEQDDDAASVMSRRAERRFLRKLDILLLTWAWLAYLIKQIDASNYKTAYANGMKEDLNMHGNELNYMDTTFRVGYAIFLIPSQIVLTKVRPSIWLPTLEVIWGVLTALMAVCSSVQPMYALRFLIGVAEASSYPGIICILCSWYTPSELATRVAIFGTSYPAANIFVGFLQTALHKSLEGSQGLRGYQWLFIINGVMTVVVAVGGFFLIPDDPANSHVPWLNTAERTVARERVHRVRKLPPTKITLPLVKRIFSSWLVYVFCLAYATWSWSQNANSWIILFLKAAKNADGTLRFGITQLNLIPIGGYVLQIIVMLFLGWLSGRTGWRAQLVIGQEITLFIGAVILACWPSSFGLKMFGYYILWLSNAAGPILISWMSDLCPSPEERSLIVGCAVTLTYVVDSFANIFIYPAKQAPNYHVGYKAAAGFAVASCAFTMLFWHLARKTAILRAPLEG